MRQRSIQFNIQSLYVELEVSTTWAYTLVIVIQNIPSYYATHGAGDHSFMIFISIVKLWPLKFSLALRGKICYPIFFIYMLSNFLFMCIGVWHEIYPFGGSEQKFTLIFGI
jgi:hypothetical protein